MTETSPSLIKHTALKRPDGHIADFCLGCGTCAAGCPMTGIDGFDPRKIVRMAMLGRDQQLADSSLPWLCTLCGRCENACPMNINIVGLIRSAREMSGKDKTPTAIRKGLEMLLETGNILGLPEEDFGFIISDVAEELNEQPGFEDFTVPLEKQGARLLCTLHNKLVNIQNEDLIHWWKIFHLAGESWTLPARNWEGVNWGLFSGEDSVLKTAVDNIVNNVERLGAQHLMYPE
jgi:heterodisulfide reductase subunit C